MAPASQIGNRDEVETQGSPLSQNVIALVLANDPLMTKTKKKTPCCRVLTFRLQRYDGHEKNIKLMHSNIPSDIYIISYWRVVKSYIIDK